LNRLAASENHSAFQRIPEFGYVARPSRLLEQPDCRRTDCRRRRTVKTVSTVQEESGVRPARGMLESVVADSRRLLELLRNAIQIAESEGQRGTVNLLDEIRDKEEKALWMLTACLEQS
jgi:hypothetical protein